MKTPSANEELKERRNEKPGDFASLGALCRLHFASLGRSPTSLTLYIDFVSKLEIALKEASEAGYWLELLLYRTDYY